MPLLPAPCAVQTTPWQRDGPDLDPVLKGLLSLLVFMPPCSVPSEPKGSVPTSPSPPLYPRSFCSSLLTQFLPLVLYKKPSGEQAVPPSSPRWLREAGAPGRSTCISLSSPTLAPSVHSPFLLWPASPSKMWWRIWRKVQKAT